ncbi:MAG TPA: protein translocase subunit SecD [Actinomycetota bacterium]|nr:protein translocase subunit SecD [Actinomycetota bacterium]
MRKHVISIVFVLALVGASVAGFLLWNLRPILGLDLVGGVSVILTAPEGTESDVLERTVETIRQRVDAVGVAEPDITRQGELNIQVQIPRFGGQSQERLLDLIGRTARLEYREVLQTYQPGTPEYERAVEDLTEGSPQNREVVFAGAEGELPTGNQDADPQELAPLYRLGPVLLTGDALERAQAAYSDPAAAGDPSQAGWLVRFFLTGEGGERFAEITRDLIGKQLAIVLDERVESAPTVQGEIPGGEGVITGNFTEQEAKDLALVLKTGALPVELERSQVETVSPTLGRESLRAGLIAGIAGLIGLALYLAFYYRLLGIVTWFGMAIWAILSLTIVAVLGKTAGYSLTLAGVAGLIISLGITADSYIVFYERLKDEVRKGKTVRTAVAPAFRRAWHTIVAANLVTITAAVVLYLLAIGSVRGFALTLGLATLLDMVVVYFFKRPTVFLIARSRRLAELPGMGLRSGVAVAPQPVVGGGE